MEKRFLSGVNSAHAAKELNRIVENVTCLECCKYYVLPETAVCGHTLCHGCWIGRQTCPVCAMPLTRRTLKSNSVLKIYSEYAETLVTSFEKLFNIKLDEQTQELPAQTIKVAKDPNKNVKAWLADSQNQFSAPVSSQLSTQVDCPMVEVSTCEIQVHTSSVKPASPTKIIIAPAPPQDDWDKIEIAPDTEDINKNKENVGPTNNEMFSFDDGMYTTDHPRRSSRKRELKSSSKPSDNSVDKHSYSNVSVDTEKLQKVKQNWSNVKKMRKEFSKLHKKNKSKLNVSIEMCKKTQSAISKAAVVESVPSQHVISIDDCTPNINCNKIDPALTLSKVIINEDIKMNKKDEIINNLSPKSKSNIQPVMNNEKNKEEMEISNNKHPNICNSKSLTDLENTCKPVESHENLITKKNIPFLRKGALQKDETDTESRAYDSKGENIKTVNHIIDDNTQTPDSDDIQITIKIGSTLTNIFIKKKKNDVKVKLNTDQEVQTTQCMEEIVTRPASSPKDIDVQNIEINIGSEGVVSAITEQRIFDDYELTNKQNKTVSTKKNTASAETVPYEITESVEKELSKIMECDGKTNDEVASDAKIQGTQIEQPGDNIKLLANELATEVSGEQGNVDVMEVDDEDIFASGSVKESNVQLLQSMKPALSEILVRKLEANKNQAQRQRQADKRDRDTNDEDMQSKKKLKVSTKIDNSKMDTEEILNDKNKDIENQSCSINYDLVMGQVFASIDADMETVDKSQSIIKNNESKAQVQTQPGAISHHSQNLKTQLTQKKTLGLSKLANSSQSINPLRQKDSEHLFTPSIRETQIVHQQKHGPETQANIENLLTPGMCRDLASTSHIESQIAQEEEKIQATPCQDKDDSDMSIYEDTPQKSSFTKKTTTKTGSAISGGQYQQKINAPQSPIEKPNESQAMPSVINISDTDMTKTGNVTVVESKPKQTLETPSTINQFYNQIKHNSTPVARKSLNFVSNQDKTLNTSSSILAKNTQEQEIIARAFEPSQKTFTKPLPNVEKLCLAASCLTAAEVKLVEKLCALRKWVFVREYTPELTHLVVGVDEEGRSQRTVKFMCAVAAGKWIVRYEWVTQCMRLGAKATEWRFEALDWTGDPGPMRARIATRKLFEGITFYCKPPFTVLNEAVLKTMLEGAGGTVAATARDVRVAGPAPRLLLAEPEHTQENQFTYLALELGIVPVNYEWALNCLGSYALGSVRALLLCPAALLPPDARRWPAVLLHDPDPDSASD